MIAIRWKEIAVKALTGAVYAGIAEISITQNITQDTLMFMVALAAIRGLIVFLQSVKDEIGKVNTTSGLEATVEPKTLLSRCL